MKKSKLSIGLVTSFIASMALSACGSSAVKSNKTNLVTGKGYDGEELSVLIDEIYDDYLKSSSGISKYYDQVMEVLIRHAFKKDQAGNDTLKGVKKNYNQIVNEAKDSVKSAKNTAKQNAETNGTSYKTEWQSILSSKGVKDENGLLESYIYDLEKTEIEDWYFDKHEAELKKEYIGVGADGTLTASQKAPARYPYHVRHILVKVEDGGSDYVRGTISSEQAKLLSNTVELLAEGVMSFGEVALKKSEDSSNTSYGDLDIMTNAASGGKLTMVNEFQLGIYAYDAIVKNAATSTVVDAGLGLNKAYEKGKDATVAANQVKSYFTNRGIVEVPYSVFKELGDVAELEDDYTTGLPVEDGKAAIYPRNLLWNRYLNNHGIFVITNGARPAAATLGADGKVVDGTEEVLDSTSSTSYYAAEDVYKKYNAKATDPLPINYSTLKSFKSSAEIFGEEKKDTAFNKANEKVLCDENNNVIIGVRSQFGIHLMIVQKSAYDFKDAVSLDDYYTTAIPGDADYPKDASGKEKTTYVNFISSVNKSEYNTRADKVRSAVKGFDSTYDYRLYEELSASADVDATSETNQKLFGKINEYIADQRRKNNDNQSEGIEQVWQTYVELLENQDFYRHGDLNRVIPEGCKIAFSGTQNEKAYEEGGACYVK